MKKFPIIFLIVFRVISAQNAAAYFPSQAGYTWLFEVAHLDSLNNPLLSGQGVRMDSMTSSHEYSGRNAYGIVSKRGVAASIKQAGYTDTNYVDPATGDGYEYYNAAYQMSALSGPLSSAGITDISSIGKAFNGWYSLYRFSSAVNSAYSVFKHDTTVTMNGSAMPVRLELTGKRLSDDSVQTKAGKFACKRFLMNFVVSYLLTIAPLPPMAIPIATFADTVCITQNKWIVKSIIPSTKIDLSLLGLGVFNVPGEITSLIPENLVFAVEAEQQQEKIGYKLDDCYPNPFNPGTTIVYHLEESGSVVVKVYNALGKEVATLVREIQNKGEHRIAFNASLLPSGVYYYQLQTGRYTAVKKMLLVK